MKSKQHSLIQVLEARQMLAAQMMISGTSGDDSISLLQLDTSTTSATIQIRNRGLATIGLTIGQIITTIKAGAKKTFSEISDIALVDLGKGDDILASDPSVKLHMAVSGGDGKDTITGGSGNDVLSGDKAQSGEFADVIHGGNGNDTIYGYGGNDELFGDAGNDSIRGGKGNDDIDGGPGKDKLFGESNNDNFTIVDGAVDSIDGGSGSDTSQPIQADKDFAFHVENVAAAAGVDNPNGSVFTVHGTPGNDVITASVDIANTLSVTINGVTVTYTSDERRAVLDAAVGQGNGDSDRIFIHGDAGNDTITAGAGIEVVEGDLGDDRLGSSSTYEPPNTLFDLVGGPGNDYLVANNKQQSTLNGDNDGFLHPEDQAVGPDGNDTLVGSRFADQFYAGAGTDFVRAGSAHATAALATESINFDEDNLQDIVDFSDRIDDLTIVFSSANHRIDVSGVNGNSEVTPVFAAPLPKLVASQGNDTITGSDLPDNIDGSSGNDQISGGNGNDTIKGGPGNDNLFGNDGSDLFINADKASDTIVGGGGRDKATKEVLDVISEVEILL